MTTRDVVELAADVIPVETLTSNEVISCLYSKNSTEKCRIGLADSVLYEFGLPTRWYLTGKTGEILKKRGLDKVALSQRWLRISAQNQSPYVAILRQDGGLYKFLTESSWNEFMATDQMPDTSIISLHCFIKGNNNLVYRNKFELRDRLGRFTTSTHSYTFFDTNEPMTDSVILAREQRFMFTESRATALKNIMDLATNTVIRYLEMVLRVKVMSISIDYIIDTKSQLWMLWPSAAKIIRDTKLWEDVKLVPGLEDKDAPDRMSWASLPRSESPGRLRTIRRQEEAGAAAASGKAHDRSKSKSPSTAVRNKAMDGRHTVTSRGKSVSTGFDFLGGISNEGEAGKSTLRRETLEVADAAAHISAATSLVDDAATKALLKTNRLGSVQANFLVNEAEGQRAHRVGKGRKSKGGETSDQSYSANPFKCKGDYCRVRLQTAGALYTEASAEIHTTDSFFSANELSELRKDPSCRGIMDSASGAEGPSMELISNQSIRLARSERRGGNGMGGSSGDSGVAGSNVWDEYPASPRTNRVKRTGVGGADLGDVDFVPDGSNNNGQQTDMQLEASRKHRDEFTKGMNVHYEQVRVCGVCSKIYRMLDWARAVLNHDHDAASNLAAKSGGANGENRRSGSRGRRPKKSEEAMSMSASTGRLPKKGIPDSKMSPNRPELGGPELDYNQSTNTQHDGTDVRSSGQSATNLKNNNNANNRRGQPQQPYPHQQQSSPKLGGTGKDKDKRTWKDYVKTSEADGITGVGTASTAMGAGFMELDDYLRGGAAKLTTKKERDRKALAGNRVHRLMPGEGDNNALGEGASLLARVKGGVRGGNLDGGDSTSLYTTADGDEEEGQYGDGLYHGKVLVACEEGKAAREAIEILEGAGFHVYWARDGREAINAFTSRANGGRLDAMDSGGMLQQSPTTGAKDNSCFDCVLVQRDLPLVNAFQITESVRMVEKTERKAAAAEAAASKRGIQPPTRRYLVICYTTATSPEDLKAYMKADMDGCVSYPVNHMSLLNTVRAAVPQHLAMVATSLSGPPPLDPTLASSALLRPAPGPKAYKLGALGEIEGIMDSSTVAAKTMSFAAGNSDDECAINGVVQIDADTRVPYMVMDASRNAKVLVNPNKPFFNLVICNDLFDTAERLKIFLRPLVQRYLGLQILLWNYPGQAFTEWREEQLLNNEYHASCLNEVLGQVGEKGTKDFDTSRPFYLMGVGHGASVATYYASHYRVPNMRGLLSFNGWVFVDSYLAGIMHDCINVFQCAPSSRPDLPVYFFSRFLFSKEYLARVSVPLALNLYTAVHNPISLAGRISLCKGVLQAVDVRPLMREIDCPVICVHSTQNALARPVHAEPFVQYRGGEVRSIFKALKDPWKTCLVWMKAGHELFQECKKPTQTLLEQIVTGFFENHDISFPAAPAVDKASLDQQGSIVSNLPWEPDRKIGKTIEDKFIDSVLDNMGKQTTPSPNKKSTGRRVGTASSPSQRSPSRSQRSPGDRQGVGTPSPSRSRSRGRSSSPKGRNILAFSANDPNAWEDFSSAVAEGQVLGKLKDKGKKKKDKAENVGMIFDHTSAMFDKQEKHRGDLTAPAGGGPGQNIHEFPEVKEYMAWRLKRNKKRLQRLQGAARIIQGTFRAYMARQYVKNMRRKKAAIQIQRCFRGWLGRLAFLDRARRIWATLLLQRAWRGYVARKQFYYRKLRVAAACNIQRAVRGHLARKFVKEVRMIRERAATIIQALFRRVQARKIAWRLRLERNSAIPIQRVFRGHLGRRRAQNERDKYIFSRSQSQGIEFGRQMLLEHKLHATKLQSDVTLLTQEKMGAEEQVEALLEEISGFEEGVRTLEKEMHQLSKVESEAAAYMDDESKYELREQKIRLDKEFGEMLGKIGSRKEMLLDLEAKLSAIDKARQTKEEELRMLERKLVVLLEEQQNELDAIKRKQDLRATMGEASGGGGGEGGTTSTALVVANAAGKGGGGGSGPSLQEKRQAAQLMQSTETLMKFGFMSMSMTYFSSLNMIKALRTVSAQDTVMAALADVQAQRASAALGVPNGGGGGLGISGGGSMGKNQFLPDLKAGQFGGQEALRVSAWSVEDVAKWLHTLSLGQYAEAFIDAAIDGEFLYDINDDDLKNTLGIEHRLHRKKILNCVHRLKIAETQRDSRLHVLLRETGSMEAASMDPDDDDGRMKVTFPGELEKTGPGDDWRQTDGPKVPLSELFSYVRNAKISLLKAALDYLPTKKFDKSLVQSPYVIDNGTVYVDGYERLLFNINKTDEFGNTLLSIACQNGNAKTCKYLVAKGANANHQNNAGQTPGHFAVAFKSFDLAKWLYENGASDVVENKFGLTAYDGLTPAEES